MSRHHPGWSSDPVRTATRVAALEAYFQQHVLRQGAFICASRGACQASTAHRFIEGQLHHIGTDYDLSWRGVPVRIAVIGQEYGRSVSHVSLRARRDMLANESARQRRFHAEPGFRARNPHMRGTTTVLRLLVGYPAGADHEQEYLQVGARRIHLFDAFALTNALLCSALKLDEDGERATSTGRSSGVMRRNCQPHFRRTLETLAPTILVVQGNAARRCVEATVDAIETPCPTVPVAGVRWGDHHALAVFASHPAAHGQASWGLNAQQRYITETLVPAVREVRRRLKLDVTV